MAIPPLKMCWRDRVTIIKALRVWSADSFGYVAGRNLGKKLSDLEGRFKAWVIKEEKEGIRNIIVHTLLRRKKPGRCTLRRGRGGNVCGDFRACGMKRPGVIVTVCWHNRTGSSGLAWKG